MLIERWQTFAADIATDPEAGPAAALIETLKPLCFQGPDVISFLQGYLTIDLEQLADGNPRLAALTNLKGRVVATGWCQMRSSERLDWLIHAELVEPVSEFMARYLAFSKTKLIDPENDSIAVGTIDDQGVPGARLLCTDGEFDAMTTTHRPVDADRWYTACIDQGSVLITPQTTEAYLPQMIGLVEAGAVDFDKGCYLGQEVVARAQHRGEVKRRVTKLTGTDSEIPPGSPVLDASGNEVGNVLMSQPPRCLAVVRQPPVAGYRVGEQQLKAAG